MKFRYIGLLLLIPALVAATYEYLSLKRAIESEKTQFVKGKISGVQTYNGFTSFEVGEVKFRMQSLLPCLDQRDKIHDGLEVSIAFKSIQRWPGSLESFGCIIGIEYIGEIKSKRSGQMSRDT